MLSTSGWCALGKSKDHATDSHTAARAFNAFVQQCLVVISVAAIVRFLGHASLSWTMGVD